jgi:hypothetical protein
MARTPRARRRAQPIAPANPPKKRGIYQNSKAGGADDLVDRVADFSYESDELAQLIVEMWLGGHGDLVMSDVTHWED